MRYCFHCRRITLGEPLFCNYCGRSYDRKLCPRRHPNPRTALVCSQCGSRDLSTPQPKGSWRSRAVIFLVRVLPGIALVLISLAALVFGIHEALDDQPGIRLAVVALLLGLFWTLYIGWSGLIGGTYRRGPQRNVRRRGKHR